MYIGVVMCCAHKPPVFVQAKSGTFRRLNFFRRLDYCEKNTSFSISGVFTSQTDGFDKSRHVVKLNVTAGTALREALTKVSVQKVEASSTDPYITSVTDKVSGDTATIRTGSVMEITGSRLKFDAADTEQGVFAVTASGEFRCATVIENKPARLMVLLAPEVPAGDFTLEVRTKITSNKNSGKTLKRSSYNRVLSAVKD